MKAYVVVGKPHLSDYCYGYYSTEASVHHELEAAQRDVDRRSRSHPGDPFIIMDADAISEHIVQPHPVMSVSLNDDKLIDIDKIDALTRRLNEIECSIPRRVEAAIRSGHRRNVCRT